MKKFLLIASMAVVFCSNVFGEEFPPSWFSDKLTFEEMEITRKNSSGEWVPFIDTTYTACEFVKVDGKIYSLDMARDEGEKKACARLDEYFKDYNIPEGLKAKHVLAGYKYNDSLGNGGAYVRVQVLVSKEKPQEKVQAASKDYKKEIEENGNLSRVLLFGDSRLTLVDKISFASEESMESHRVSYTKKEDSHGNSKSSHSKSKESLYYPDGSLVHDTVLHLKEILLEFNLKNVVKGRKTLIIIRTDVKTENKTLTLVYNGKEYTSNIEADSKNRWRNCIFEIEEGSIIEYSPRFILKDLPSEQGIALVSIYQDL